MKKESKSSKDNDKTCILERVEKEIDTQKDVDTRVINLLSDDTKGMLMHDIVNMLANKKCTIEDAEDILNGTMRSIRITSKVERLKW